MYYISKLCFQHYPGPAPAKRAGLRVKGSEMTTWIMNIGNTIHYCY
jgi:hypothetical protein